MKIPLLPNNEGKKSVDDAGPQQDHDRALVLTAAGVDNHSARPIICKSYPP